MKTDSRKISLRKERCWILIYHPNTLHHACVTAEYLSHCHGMDCHLVVLDHWYYRYVDWSRYRTKFAAVHVFPNLFPSFTLKHNLHLLKEIWRFKRQLRNLGIRSDDLIVTFSPAWYLENTFCSVFRKNPAISITGIFEYTFMDEGADPSKYRLCRAGKYSRYFVEPLTGLHRTKFIHHRKIDSNNIDEGVDGLGIFIHYDKPWTDFYDAMLVTCSPPRLDPCHPKARATMHPFLRPDPALRSKANKVIYAGSGIVCQNHKNQQQFIQIVNRCLDYVRRHYGGRYQLCFRPKPCHEHEATLVNLEGFTVESDGELAEFYFSNRRDEIAAVFTDCSSASLVGLHCGIPSYCFLHLLPMAEDTLNYWIKGLSRLPPEFWIMNLESAPKPHTLFQGAPVEEGVRAFQTNLNWAVELAKSSQRDR